jgi:hypothetical protein
MKILYVEDNEDNIFMLKSRLTRGLHVIVPPTARERAGGNKRAAGPRSHGSDPPVLDG